MKYQNYEICSHLPIKTTGRRQWLRPDIFIFKIEQISHILLMIQLFDFEQVNVSWKNNYAEEHQSSFL